MELDTGTAVAEPLLDTPLPTTHRAPVQVRGLDLLDLVIHQIELDPDVWNQGTWRCETGMCVAGWAATLAGGKWATEDCEDTYGAYLLHDAAIDGESTGPSPDFPHERTPDGTPVTAASHRAMTLLGISDETADDLFNGGNELEDIKIIRDAIAEGRQESRLTRYARVGQPIGGEDARDIW